ncbi:hypothetical protein BX616_004423 [Lobosporangium transversale]|uniref:SRPBCC domain-containing protein n=1 Tax=Lobosporangium transversale TaxID=64571 RepID=A0A1Y2GNB3_9FUNG|nr:hypothetical protein BCR41DRAFT_386538 [Lobosporangium transversale]KAF9918914.1 hypothetical protein BX616_004423 [Lobosporangium transversale]ORZ16187.1 hypothetical protein BCR41DRAFT_386538 [Lobosporangium transversale]|eukprot:XP_021881534.1 hypothetical protein BCR41DRAFT_386538 [Lobosporangium transversale]
MNEIKTTITIPAPPKEVWEVLTDLSHYHEWNPMIVQAKGTIEEGEALDLKIRLPSTIFCGAPISISQAPKVLKVEPEACLQWIVPATFIRSAEGTHYFQLTSSQNGAATEFTQGERFSGWSSGFYLGIGTVSDVRRGFVIMNNALRMETLRRREAESEKSISVDRHNEGLDEKTAQSNINNGATVAVATGAIIRMSSHPAQEDPVLKTDVDVQGVVEIEAIATDEIDTTRNRTTWRTEKSRKRTSIIDAVSSLFSSTRIPMVGHIPISASKEELIAKTIPLEQEQEVASWDYPPGCLSSIGENEEEEEDKYEEMIEDLIVKAGREARNAQRIELDFGPSDLDLGDFAI